LRRELGIADDARTLLYAPTWRDDRKLALAIDLDRLAAAFPRDTVLMRAHSLVADQIQGRIPGSVRDVSRHTEVSELYLSADVLITDYSSAMFDFAVTGKPIVLFTYDLEYYRDEMRGFYFDLEAQAPGPLVSTTEDLIAVLRDLDAVRRDYAGAYARFRDRFCALEDGAASRRVVSAFFER
jgi:CDP-glycerol glycerophosphotransferase